MVSSAFIDATRAPHLTPFLRAAVLAQGLTYEFIHIADEETDAGEWFRLSAHVAWKKKDHAVVLCWNVVEVDGESFLRAASELRSLGSRPIGPSLLFGEMASKKPKSTRLQPDFSCGTSNWSQWQPRFVRLVTKKHRIAPPPCANARLDSRLMSYCVHAANDAIVQVREFFDCVAFCTAFGPQAKL